MTLGPVRVMGAGVIVMLHAEEVCYNYPIMEEHFGVQIIIKLLHVIYKCYSNEGVIHLQSILIG